MMNKIIKLFVSIMGAAGAGFLSQMILASFFEKKFVGDFLWAISTTTTLGALFGLGYSGLILAEGKSNSNFVKNVSYAIKIPLALCLLVACSLAVVYLTVDIYALKSMYLLILISVILFSALQPLGVCYYQINMQPQKTGNFQLITNVGRLISLCVVLLIPIIKNKEDFVLFFYSSLGALNAFYIVYLWQKWTNFFSLKIRLLDVVVSVKNTFGYSVNVFFSIYALNAIVVFSGFYLPAHSVAQIAFAMAFMQLLHLLPTTIYSYFLQGKIHFNKGNKQFLVRLLKQSFLGSIFLVLFVFMLIGYVFKPIMVYFFANKYIGAVDILLVISMTIFFRSMSTCLGAITNFTELIGYKMRCQVFVLVLSIITYPILTHYYGLFGLLVSFILIEILICVLYFYTVYSYLCGVSKK